jgi:hypothetical protein
MTAGDDDDALYGPWRPGVESQIPAALLPLATIWRSEHVRTSLADALELADFSGLPASDLAAFRPQRLALHELLVRVTANVSVPDGTRIEDLGINFRQITRTLLEREVMPRMTAITEAYDQARATLRAIVDRELATLFSPQPVAEPRKGWFGRLRRTEAAAPPPTHADVVAGWESRARAAQGAERAALRALARVAGALLVRYERMGSDSEPVARLATDLAANEWGSDVIGSHVEPLVTQGAAREGYKLLPRQEHPLVMNTKGPSASGKSSMRPLQKKLAGRIGVDWTEFALISPDIWRKQLLDYASLGAAYKYAGAFTGDEVAIVDRKLDRYMARKAERGDMSHLLIDRFRFDSFAPDSDEAGSNLLTRFGQIVYLFFLVTPPAALVERAWYRGLDVGRYKAVDDTLAHAVEAYAGMPELFFTWIRRSDKRVHFEFLDNSVPRGEEPRTAAFGWNGALNVLDLGCLLDIERFRKIDIDAKSPQSLYPPGAALEAAHNLRFLEQCLAEFADVNFADQASGQVYMRVSRRKVVWADRAAMPAAVRETLVQILGSGEWPPHDGRPVTLAAGERAHTVGAWASGA